MSVLLAFAILTSGLHGVVSRGPTRPVCQVGVPCSQPVVGTTLVFSRNGAVVATVKTGSGGHYSVRLRPGVYSVRSQATPKVGAGMRPRQVRVKAGVFARADFMIDTGIR